MKEVYYTKPPADCNICGYPLGNEMYDAKVRGGLWANVCHRCFVNEGGKLGTGFGQKYERQPHNGRWLKTAG